MFAGLLLCNFERLGQNDLVALFQGDDGFFPVCRATRLGGALAAGFAADVQRVDADDLDLEQFLHSLADLRLGRKAVGHDGILIILLTLARALFRQADGLDDFKSVHGFKLVK